MELRPKEIKLLKNLTQQFEPITSRCLAHEIGVSARTIKNYVNTINHLYPGLIESTPIGYQLLDKTQASEIINYHIKTAIPSDFNQRKNYLLKKLLIEKPQVSQTQLLEELFISLETLHDDINKIRRMLIDFDLTLSIQQDILAINGPAYNKKKLLSHLISEESKNSFLSLSLMQSYLPNYDLTIIKNIIQEALTKFEYFMDDFSLLNFILHLGVTMERAVEEVDYSTTSQKIILSQDVIDMIEYISTKIHEEFTVSFTKSEKYDFGLLIMTRIISHSINQLTLKQLHEVVGSDVIKLVTDIQNQVHSTFGIKFSNKDFTIRFSLHLKNLLTRLENKLFLENLQLLTIKNTYPFIYDVSVFIANIIMEYTGFALSEDEMAYISLHVGVLIEEHKAISNKVKVVFLHPQYFFNSLDIVNRCIEQFQDDLLVLGIAKSEDELIYYEDYNLLITSIPLTKAYDVATAQISFALSEKCIQTIQNHIYHIKRNREIQKIKKNLTLLFNKDLFFANQPNRNKDETINLLCDSLEQNGYVDENFRIKIFEREAISPSAFVNVALPHPLGMIALKSAIAVSLHPQPIEWNSNQVKIVFMIATSVEDRLYFKDIFDFVSRILVDTEKVSHIAKITDYDTFISTLINFFEEIQ